MKKLAITGARRFRTAKTIAVGALALLLFSLSPVVSSQAENGTGDDWVVRSTEGDTTVRRDRSRGWRAPNVGQRLIPGTHIKTGRTGSLRIDRNGDRITVAPFSVVELPVAKGNERPSGVIQTLGTLLYKIVTRKQDRFSVQTPYMAAVIKGTTFTVKVGDQGTALHVTEGAVQVRSLFSGQTALIRPGQTGEVSSTGRRGLRVRHGSRRSRATNPGHRTGEKAGPTQPEKTAGKDAKAGRVRISRSFGESRINIREVTRGLADDTSNRGTVPSKSKGSGKSDGAGNSKQAKSAAKSDKTGKPDKSGKSGKSGKGSRPKGPKKSFADVGASMNSGRVSVGAAAASNSGSGSSSSGSSAAAGASAGAASAMSSGVASAVASSSNKGKGKGKGKGKKK